MREFLMGLYLEHGEREFLITHLLFSEVLADSMDEGFIEYPPNPEANIYGWLPLILTPKGLEYLKNA